LSIAGTRFWYANDPSESHEGLTFDITVAGENEGARIFRFDCFNKIPDVLASDNLATGFH
jgi:hypothetical protein